MAVSYVGSATGTTSATLPAHQAGDLIVIWAYNETNNTIPTLVGGYTGILSGGASNNAANSGYKVAASDSETSGTWTNATSLIAHVYRGVDQVTPVGASAQTNALGTLVTYPTITLQQQDNTSWVAAFAGIKPTNSTLETPPTGMVNRSTVVDATDEAAGHDTNGAVNSWPSTDVEVGGTSSAWRSLTIEIRSGAAAAKWWDESFMRSGV